MPTNIQAEWFGGPKADLGDEIEYSARFRGSQSLNRTISSNAGSGTDVTFSYWIKAEGTSSTQSLMFYSGNNYVQFSLDGKWRNYNGTAANSDSTFQFRDSSAWYHFVSWGDGTTTAGKNRFWVNGKEITPYMSAMAAMSLSHASANTNFTIGASNSNTQYFDGLVAELHCFEGAQVHPDELGRYTETGVWVPKTYAGSSSNYGSRGFYLKFNPAGNGVYHNIGADWSGNGNNFTASGFNLTATSSTNFDNDNSEDTPTNNCATFKPNVRSYNPITRTNLRTSALSANDQYFSVISQRADFPVYYEAFIESASNGYPGFGVCNDFKAKNVYQGYDVGGLGIASDTNSYHFQQNGSRYIKSSHGSPAGQPTFTTNDIVGIAFDPTTGVMQFNVNGGTFFNPFGTIPQSEINDDLMRYMVVAMNNTGSGAVCNINLGQRPFVYTPPAGHKALISVNHDTPAIPDGREHCQVFLGAGTGYTVYRESRQSNPDPQAKINTAERMGSTPTSGFNASQVLFDAGRLVTTAEVGNKTSLGYWATTGSYQPVTTLVSATGEANSWTQVDQQQMTDQSHDDYVAINRPNNPFRWIRMQKPLDNSGLFLAGSTVGGIKELAESAFTNGLRVIRNRSGGNLQFISDQYTGSINCPTANAYQATWPSYSTPSGDSLAWTWKTDSNGLNAEAGFQIIQQQGNMAAGTISHSLGKRPDFVIAYADRADLAMTTSHVGAGNNLDRQMLSSDSQYYAGEGYWGSSSDWTSTTFGVGANSYTNDNGNNNGGNVYLVWTSIEGYSKFGSYVGNANADGPCIYLGFKPRILWIKKKSGTGHWMMYDTERRQFNPNSNVIYANQTTTEYTSTGYPVDIMSDGFKIRVNDSHLNTGSNDYVYCAWAEAPSYGKNQPPMTAL